MSDEELSRAENARIVALPVTGAAGGDEVLPPVVEGIAVQVVAYDPRRLEPEEEAPAPVAWVGAWPERLEEHEPMHGDVPVTHRERVIRQVALGVPGGHSSNDTRNREG